MLKQIHQSLTKIILRESGVLELIAYLQRVLICATDKKDGLEVHEFLSWDVVNCVDEEDLLLEDLSA